MELVLLLVGLACIIAAIIGGGVKLGQLEIPKFSSGRRQLLLGGFGSILFLFGLGSAVEPVDLGNASAQAGPGPASAAADTADNSAAAVAAVAGKVEQPGKPEPEPAAALSSKPVDLLEEDGPITGEWLDQFQNRWGFNEERRLAALIAAGTTQPVLGQMQVSDGYVDWSVGRLYCRARIVGDSEAMSGSCGLDGATDQDPIELTRL